MKGQAFGRAKAMFALVAAAMSLAPLARQEALAAISPYRSRGKGTGTPHPKKMTRITQRAAHKARNVMRNRRAHRG